MKMIEVDYEQWVTPLKDAMETYAKKKLKMNSLEEFVDVVLYGDSFERILNNDEDLIKKMDLEFRKNTAEYADVFKHITNDYAQKRYSFDDKIDIVNDFIYYVFLKLNGEVASLKEYYSQMSDEEKLNMFLGRYACDYRKGTITKVNSKPFSREVVIPMIKDLFTGSTDEEVERVYKVLEEYEYVYFSSYRNTDEDYF